MLFYSGFGVLAGMTKGGAGAFLQCTLCIAPPTVRGVTGDKVGKGGDIWVGFLFGFGGWPYLLLLVLGFGSFKMNALETSPFWNCVGLAF